MLGSAWRFAYEGSDLAPYKARFDIKTNESHGDTRIWGPIEELIRLVNTTESASTEEAMLADTLKPYSNGEYQTAREALLSFPEARITYVRCEVAKQTGATRPSGCQ